MQKRGKFRQNFSSTLGNSLLYIRKFLPQKTGSQKKTLFFPNMHSTLVCVSSYASSKNLCESIKSHTGCIFLTFIHCVFSNVTLMNLDQSMHSHIIGLTFLHCAFSNVSSNRFYKRMHSHIGCIGLTFLQCVFLDVSSNGLPC